LATAKKLSTEQAKLYDIFDKANDACARKFLLDSISTELSKHILERLDADPMFATVWLQFIKTIQSTSMARFEDIAKKISFLLDQVQRLIRTVDSLRTPHVHSRGFGRKGENRNMNRLNASDDPGSDPRHRPQHHHAHAAYQPTPANGHHGFGNNGLTHRQRQAAQKIASHFNMAGINLGLAPVDNAATLRMALQAPHCFRHAFPKEALMSIIWDSGAIR
jgi:hypothetical protein